MTLTELITALESLGGPCRDMDDKIATAIWGEPQPIGNAGEPKTLHWEMSPGFYRSRSPCFTESLDAALTLVPEGWWWGITQFGGAVPRPSGYTASLWTLMRHGKVALKMEPSDPVEQVDQSGTARTPALAVCIAALRARLTEG